MNRRRKTKKKSKKINRKHKSKPNTTFQYLLPTMMPKMIETRATPKMNLKFKAGDTSAGLSCASEDDAGAEVASDFFLLFLFEGVAVDRSMSRDFMVSSLCSETSCIIVHK